MKNLANKRFGAGIVLQKAYKKPVGKLKKNQQFWRLICDCGNYYYASTNQLNTGNKKSCGCSRQAKLNGMKFGKGSVNRLIGRDKHGACLWELACECGTIYNCSSYQLTSGRTKSCGCNNKTPENFGEIKSQYWIRLQRAAKTRGIEFNLTREYVWGIFLNQNRQCSYTGIQLTLPRSNLGNGRNCTASLDRIDSNKGYVEGNVQWVHKHINAMKWQFTHEEFLQYCHLITQNHNLKPVLVNFNL